MFDVIRVSPRDRDIYPFLVDTYGWTGYFKIEPEDDPRRPTSISLHVGARTISGRDEVLGYLAREWGASKADVERGFREAKSRWSGGLPLEECGCPVTKPAGAVYVSPAGQVRRRAFAVPSGYCWMAPENQYDFLRHNMPSSSAATVSRAYNLLVPICVSYRAKHREPMIVPGRPLSSTVAAGQVDSGSVAVVDEDTGTVQDLTTAPWWKIAGLFAAGSVLGWWLSKS